MALPEFNSDGDLPEGLYEATLAEVEDRFGTGSDRWFLIANDTELRGTRERIAYFEDLLAQMRVTARPDLFPTMASGYRAEIEKMQREILDYLTRHVSDIPAAVA
jgi:hypothetical protein